MPRKKKSGSVKLSDKGRGSADAEKPKKRTAQKPKNRTTQKAKNRTAGKAKNRTVLTPRQAASELANSLDREILEHMEAEPVSLPAIPEDRHISRSYVSCPYHPKVQFRAGGFCEKCYEEDSQDRMQNLDAKLDEKVLKELDKLIPQILAGPPEVIERFVGRIMSRFSRPQKTQVEGTLKAFHLHAPVDFAQRK